VAHATSAIGEGARRSTRSAAPTVAAAPRSRLADRMAPNGRDTQGCGQWEPGKGTDIPRHWRRRHGLARALVEAATRFNQLVLGRVVSHRSHVAPWIALAQTQAMGHGPYRLFRFAAHRIDQGDCGLGLGRSQG